MHNLFNGLSHFIGPMLSTFFCCIDQHQNFFGKHKGMCVVCFFFVVKGVLLVAFVVFILDILGDIVVLDAQLQKSNEE